MDAAFAQTVLEHSPDALVLLAPDGSISFLNTAAERLFGYSRAQLLGADYSLLLAEASREDFHQLLTGLAAGNSNVAGSGAGATRLPFAGAGRRGDASEFALEITCAALPPAAGSTGSDAAVALSVRPATAGPSVTGPSAAATQSATAHDAGATAAAAPPRRRARRCNCWSPAARQNRP